MSAPEEDGSRVGANEWNRCVRRGCWSIALGTIVGAVASVFVFSDAPVIFGTSLGVGWALRNCRSQLRDTEMPPITMEQKEDDEIPDPQNMSECTCGDNEPDPGGLLKPGSRHPPLRHNYEDMEDAELIQEIIPKDNTYDEEYEWSEAIHQEPEEAEPAFDKPYEVDGSGVDISESETNFHVALKDSESLQSLVPVENTALEEEKLPCTCELQYFFNTPPGDEPQTQVAEQIISRIQEFGSGGPEITLAFLKELAKNQSAQLKDKKAAPENNHKKND